MIQLIDQTFLALRQAGLEVRRDECLSRQCSWRIGGPAAGLVEPRSASELATALTLGTRSGIPVVVIGRGSNCLFDDAGLRGLVIKIGPALASLEIAGDRITVGAGTIPWRLARAAGRAGLSGLQHIVGIPGTLGGLVTMNGGSLRQNLGDAIEWVEAIDRDTGQIVRLAAADCDFRYRHSRFLAPDNRLIVLRCGLRLAPGNPAALRTEMLAILRERRGKFPLKSPNAGSVFKSTASAYEHFGPPGRIVESLGMKGTQVGGAQVSERHANFIINTGNATAADVLALVALVRQRAKEQLGIELETEVRYLAPDGISMPLAAAASLAKGLRV
jgi:UDP-N-acetylmuramate dehydrogenase